MQNKEIKITGDYHDINVPGHKSAGIFNGVIILKVIDENKTRIIWEIKDEDGQTLAYKSREYFSKDKNIKLDELTDLAREKIQDYRINRNKIFSNVTIDVSKTVDLGQS
ncbi:MAG TPA: hypothetical protein VFU05_13830 [Cyclobacteriaceae bacterium]|nr:hypothetical protein [Cyclobacteriaceae bacterium]